MEIKKKNMKVSETILLFTLILSGFYGGIGFLTILGNNPAIGNLSGRAFIEYWQNVDYYMAARMKIFWATLIAFSYHQHCYTLPEPFTVFILDVGNRDFNSHWRFDYWLISQSSAQPTYSKPKP